MKNIIIVDDHSVVIMAIKNVLQQHGYHMLLARRMAGLITVLLANIPYLFIIPHQKVVMLGLTDLIANNF